MKLLFKQRAFSWLDSYDVYNEEGATVYTVKGQLSWGHCLKIYDVHGQEIGTVKQRLWTWQPQFELYLGDTYAGSIRKQFQLFSPTYHIDGNGWRVEGDVFEWDYRILNPSGYTVAAISKELFRWTDTYVIDVQHPQDALYALMVVLAIDAEKCSRDD